MLLEWFSGDGGSVHLFLSFQEVCATHDVEGPREALVGELCAWELLTAMGLMGTSSYCSDMKSDDCQTLCNVCCGIVVLCWIG